jgi:alginate O-acetyltransferase complex protein AlgJ
MMIQNPKYSSREAQALAEAGKTAVSPAQKILLVSVFLFTIFAVPLSQQVFDVRDYFTGVRKTMVPSCYGIFHSAVSAVVQALKPDGRLAGRLLEANRQMLRAMHSFENEIEDSAVVGRTIRPFTQYVMVSWLGAGNDKTYCGRHRWLFYRPDVDGVINHGFLKPGIMTRKITAVAETKKPPQPDPRLAIIAFHNELAMRGIRLIIMPTPLKTAVHPEKLAAGFDNFDRPIHNASYDEFARDIKQEGILVFDAASILVAAKRTSGRDQFLERDTHWRPEAMELCARGLSDFIRKNIVFHPPSTAVYRAVSMNIVQRGDILAMLCLPEGIHGYGREHVVVRRILDNEGRSWQPSPESEVLVLGDSFSNIYSLEALGWGHGAGFVEQLSCELGLPVDRIAVNDNGAWATREALRKELALGNDRLAGKRAVVWQFAERELNEGNWKILPLEVVAKAVAFMKLPPGSRLTVRGRIEKITKAPRPRSVPYVDHIIAAHLVDVRDSANQYGQALVYLFSMTNNVLTRAAVLKAGDAVEIRLCPWSDVSAKYERINRTDLDDPELLAQEPCWGEIIAGTD